MSPLLPLLLIVVCALTIVSLALLYASAAIADATFDGLTGLMVPRAFRRLVREEIARAQATQGRSLSLWFVDTDHFKRINDAFGHRAGDAVLVAIASLLKRHLKRELDVGARNGGDEFCALLRGATKSSAIDRAQQFCDAVRAHDFGLPVRVTRRRSVSFRCIEFGRVARSGRRGDVL